MKNELAREIHLSEGKNQYDTQCKRILSHKIILAWILKYTAKEFADMTIRQIEECIGDDVKITQISVAPGETNTETTEKIAGVSNEDKIPGEGDIYFDIRFTALFSKKKEIIKLLINLEAQRDFYPGYSIVTRGIYYGARMISSQKGTEFSGSNYDEIKKVYSIWICMNAPQYIGNTISEYSMTKRDIVEGMPDQKSAYDKMSIIIITLNENCKTGNKLTEMLSVLLSSAIAPADKIEIMEKEYEIPMERKIKKELNQMCNLSDYVEEIGIKKGIVQGIKRGKVLQQIEIIQKRLQKGKSLQEIAEGMGEEETAIACIYNCVKENISLSSEEIMEKLNIVSE